MSRIFMILAFVVSFFGPASCAENEIDHVTLPADVAAVTSPFIAAVKRGDQAAIEKRMTASFVDDSRAQFDNMAVLLKKSPPLTPAIYVPKPSTFGPNQNEVSVTYAAHDGTKWTSAEIRLYRTEGGPFEVEYWDVKSTTEPPALIAHAKEMRTFMSWIMGALAIIALLGLLLLIWVVKRRPHILAPNSAPESRRVAAIVRDSE